MEERATEEQEKAEARDKVAVSLAKAKKTAVEGMSEREQNLPPHLMGM